MTDANVAKLLERTRWLGKAGFLIDGRLKVYVHPSAIAGAGDLPKADVVLVRENHPDHCSVPDVESVSVAQTVVAGPPECVCRFRLNQLPFAADQTKPLLGMKVTMTRRGFLFEIDGVRVYHPGSGEPESDVAADVLLIPGKGIVTPAAR
ncbi:MAG: MBL fold metallo-hydrolase [Elusimicrobia bacterium]|nr:MBL fold metallo-hydrolase [Elusimicrobiota bacterium]